MANMIPISTVTIGSGGASTIQFNNVPQTYTDLMIVSSLRGNQAGATFAYITLNGLTSGFNSRYIYSDGQSSASGTDGGRAVNYATGTSVTANAFSSAYLYISNYTSSNNKPISIDTVLEQNQSNNAMFLSAMLWANTSPITTISLDVSTGLFAQYSSATLYGIRKY